MNDVDVVVIGSGVAGLCAAIEAANAGSSVLVAEAEDVVGGSSRLSGAQMLAAGTRYQRQHGIEDTADDLYFEYMAANQWLLEPAVVRRLVDDSADAVEWLGDLGLQYAPEIYFAAEERVPRAHLPIGLGAAVIDLLRAEAVTRSVTIALKRRVDRLIMEQDRVVGVAVGGDELRCGAVVVASGGLGANPELVNKYLPKTAAAGTWFWYIGADGARGDHIGFAAQCDAQIVGADRGIVTLTPNFGHLLESSLPGWLIVVDEHGRRFYDETLSYSATEKIIGAQPGPVYAIFDDAAKTSARTSTAGSAKKADVPGPTTKRWVEPILDEMIANGVITTADTLAGLAQQIGVPPDSLDGTVRRYNDDVDRGSDRSFGKPAHLMSTIARGPFYATELRLAFLANTFTGLRVDPEAQVIASNSHPIPGLYAAGEAAGGVVGDYYFGGGNSYTACIVYGRIAGRHAHVFATGTLREHADVR